MKVICFKNEEGIERSVLHRGFAIYNKGTQFFRVRPLKEDDTIVPLKDMRI